MSFRLMCVVVFLTCLLPGCKDRVGRKDGVLNLLVFVDQSDSISAPQRHTWLGDVRKLLSCLPSRVETHVYVYGLHDHTAEAAPSSITIPALATDAVHEDVVARKKAVATAMADLMAALNSDSPSRSTDIFAVFDRSSAAAHAGPTKVVIFSDMLHVTRELNMERQAIHEQDFERIFSQIAQAHRWSSDTLHGAEVYAVLPSIEKNSTTEIVNDRRLLGRFYGDLVHSLNGKLLSFETDLQSGGGL